MIYTCQHCGAFFPTEDLREAMKIKNNTMIKCTYCNRGTEFRAIRSSHIADGYRELGYGKFYRAEQAFAMAIQEARRHQKDASPDVYLGQALAQARVQTIFPDDDEYHLEKPELICHQYNEMEFSNSSLYLTAQELVPKTDEAESSRIASYAEYIDNVRDYYKKISASRAGKGDYSVFIAYEDDETNNKGYRCAQDIHTALPDEVFRNSFLPNIDNYKKGQGYKDEEKQEYEAAIMYALDHSKCMLVVVDDHINSRLLNIYARYFNKISGQGRNNKIEAVERLGFVRYRDKITITLPDGAAAEKNVFNIEDRSKFNDFVCYNNNILINRTFEPKVNEKANEEAVIIHADHTDTNISGKPYRRLNGNRFEFGHYPQRREASVSIEKHFAQYPRPSISADNGWTVMFYDGANRPYTWYRDEEIKGKKYRAVFFTKHREVYSLQNSNLKPREQRLHGYMPFKIYCFEFEPLIWNSAHSEAEDNAKGFATLVTDQGIDCQEFNHDVMDNGWIYSTIRHWLNEDFLHVAFNDNEISCLMDSVTMGEHDKISLIDKQSDREFYESRHNAILGSDYFKCIGGMGERSINSYWVTSSDSERFDEATVIYPTTERRSLATCFVDSTVVAVLPKITLKL